jgi:hypothetical protein
MLRAMLSRHARAGGGILLGLDEPRWRWVMDRLDPAHAEPLEVLHERHAVLTERQRSLLGS